MARTYGHGTGGQPITHCGCCRGCGKSYRLFHLRHKDDARLAEVAPAAPYVRLHAYKHRVWGKDS